ncbi:hypothetical protein SDRG_04564 [Saprolegnia diclina VS20]|uniref:Mannosyltransferase n=1 Tax=Saprolegnia diclina (strain VS20) TaxID=1156394 RepID=T0QJD3_SAPDV|nr:hypothetical protein SDRG_04564 [Saprolegnia diclina VS20]EQC38134.1 hypothetical protein SDRG_04564 [Saprolegnia diclina VS20]|eukprot:XP_008608461.1 hypothetical protein SDRG_04564 [Saprolegnia diclina VS20]
MTTGWALAYGGALVLRAASIFSMGMVHPDEFFQCPEVMARAVYNVSSAFIPWEYQPSAPNRSILFPSLVAGIPYAVAKALGVAPSGLLFLVVPRVILTLLSLGFDTAIYTLARTYDIDYKGPLLVFATSWTTLVLLTRSFSNTFEAFLLMLSFVVLHTTTPRQYAGVVSRQNLLLGALLALGSFTRFTFLLFFFPLGLALVASNDALLCASLAKKSDVHTPSPFQRLIGVGATGLGGAIAFVLTSIGVVLVDTCFFRGWEALYDVHSWVVAPWNNLVYNMNPAHLAAHGLHTRSNHWLINMQLLFGPLPALALLYGRRHRLLLASIVVPVSLLSLAPHQEARFLLPVVFPLMLASGPALAASKPLQGLWAVFNTLVYLWYGVLHQGGLVPMLLSSSTPYCKHISLTNVHTILMSGTYMPPRFALSPHAIHIVDERLEDMQAPLDALVQSLPRDARGRTGAVFVYPAPLAADVEALIAAIPHLGLDTTEPMGTCGPFLAMESLPTNVLDLTEWSLRLQHIVVRGDE